MKDSNQKQRYNIYYSSPNYYLYDGDETGEVVFKTTYWNEVFEKQKELEEKNNEESNN
jgi:hypothetical protein